MNVTTTMGETPQHKTMFGIADEDFDTCGVAVAVAMNEFQAAIVADGKTYDDCIVPDPMNTALAPGRTSAAKLGFSPPTTDPLDVTRPVVLDPNINSLAKVKACTIVLASAHNRLEKCTNRYWI